MVTLAPPAVVAPHGRDLLGWHGLSAAVMAAMLVVAFPAWLAGVATAVFGVGLLWCTAKAVRLSPRAAYVRLGVCCLAMLAMLVPLAVPQVLAAGDRSGASMAGPQSGGMAAHSMGGGTVLSAGPGSFALVLAGVLVCLAVAGVARVVPGSTTARSRAAGLAEALLAAVMAAMLVGAV